MAGDRELDVKISAWLEEEAPTGLPQHVLTATFEQTRRRRRQLGWRGVLGRRPMPRFLPALGGSAAVVLAAVLALNLFPLGGVAGPVSPSPSPSLSASPSEAEITALLDRFLEARLAGEGAEAYLAEPSIDVPLLYATTSGAPFERGEFAHVDGVDWPYGFRAFIVRLFAGDTVVEQLFFVPRDDPEAVPTDGRLLLHYQPDGFATEIAPTTEDGEPVPTSISDPGLALTMRAAHPWLFHGPSPVVPFVGRLIPEGPVPPTTDGGERNDWDELHVMADPAWVGTDCQAGPAENAGALAERIRSDPGLEATDAVAVQVGATDALVMDVRLEAGAPICAPASAGGDVLPNSILRPVWGDELVTQGDGLATGQANGEWIRLYLLDAPEGSPMEILAIAIVAPEATFERATKAAEPVVASIELTAP